MDAAPSGSPGCPECACSTASTDRNRTVLIQSWSSSSAVLGERWARLSSRRPLDGGSEMVEERDSDLELMRDHLAAPGLRLGDEFANEGNQTYRMRRTA